MPRNIENDPYSEGYNCIRNSILNSSENTLHIYENDHLSSIGNNSNPNISETPNRRSIVNIF